MWGGGGRVGGESERWSIVLASGVVGGNFLYISIV